MCSILFYQNLVKSLANHQQKFNSTIEPIFNQYRSVRSGRMIYFRENSNEIGTFERSPERKFHFFFNFFFVFASLDLQTGGTGKNVLPTFASCSHFTTPSHSPLSPASKYFSATFKALFYS